MLHDWLHYHYEGLLILAALCGGLKYMAMLVSEATEIKVSVNLLLTNHIPHLQADIKDLRDKFIAHLEATK